MTNRLRSILNPEQLHALGQISADFAMLKQIADDIAELSADLADFHRTYN
jgi:hypothetical protein